MKVDINNIVSINEANQDFSRIASLVDERGPAVILKNNVPRYNIMAISEFRQEEVASDDLWCQNAFLKKTVTPMRCFQDKGF